MESEISKLRKKFIVLSSVIVFSVIFIMIVILNLFMSVSYKNANKTASQMLSHTALAEVPDTDTERISLSDLSLNEDGDYIVTRDPGTIENVTLYGSITSTDPQTHWYNAGGGLMFEAVTDNGTKLVYHEYVFNKDTQSITISFTDYSNIMCDGQPFAIDGSQVSGDYFLVSIVWWTSSSDMFSDTQSKISLKLNDIEIHYRHDKNAASQRIQHRDFSASFPGGMPAALSSVSGFYLITDKNGNLFEVNSGNLVNNITDEDAYSYISNNTCTINNVKYECFVSGNDMWKVYTFLYNGDQSKSMHKLVFISSLLGITVFLLLFVAIYLASGSVVRSVSESYEKQKQFISNASHELKTPITVISATADLMKQRQKDDKWVECIKVQSEKMKNLVYEMLELTRLSETKKTVNNFLKFDLSQCISNSLLYFESRAFEEQKTLESNIPEGIYLNGNEVKIERLVSILVDNALKYSDDGGVISFTVKTDKDKVHLICENPCVSFNESDTRHLFERFYRSDESHSDEHAGFGLGLSIAQKITEVHRGSIDVSFNYPVVRFTVILPK